MAPAAALAAASGQFVKGICGVIFPPAMPLEEQFRQAKNAGFDGIEIRPGTELGPDTALDQAARIGDQARKAGVAIVSLWVSDVLSRTPLNHRDPAIRSQGVETIHKSIEVAKAIGCGALLLVPGSLGSGAKFLYSYQDTWDRFTAELKKVVAHAAEARVYLTPENVSNKFLVSPLEMRAFVDGLNSPWFQSHFDIGNVMQFGYPQDWILTLGPRIKRIHVKDFKLRTRTEPARPAELLEGDVDWQDVMDALKKIGYRGFMSPEMGHKPNDPEYLRKVSRALDTILAM